MGEMMSMITHQWRQPLTAINSAVGIIDLMRQIGESDPDKEKYSIETIYRQVEYLSETIEDFRNFFSKDKKSEQLSLGDVCKQNNGTGKGMR